LAVDFCQPEAVPVHRVDVVGGVAHRRTVALSFFEVKHRGHGPHVERDLSKAQELAGFRPEAAAWQA